MINARSETVAAKPAYRGLIATAAGRALLPADGFFEWLRSEDRKQPRQPFRFTVDDGGPFALAGLWTEGWQDGARVASVTILTCPANRLVARLHDRMPVILPDRASERAWLDPRFDADAAAAVCVPCPPSGSTRQRPIPPSTGPPRTARGPRAAAGPPPALPGLYEDSAAQRGRRGSPAAPAPSAPTANAVSRRAVTCGRAVGDEPRRLGAERRARPAAAPAATGGTGRARTVRSTRSSRSALWTMPDPLSTSFSGCPGKAPQDARGVRKPTPSRR